MSSTTAGHVDVRVRRAESAESGATFTTWPIDDLDRLVGLFNRWGNPVDEGLNAVGQFSFDPGDVWYFELVVGEC